ncbi:MAG: winged helix-turn-helix domain-containing protein, partial [Janthinobacterium sp.]
HLCEWGEEVSNNAIEVYVHRLRKKIEVGGVRIATVRGLGYCLEKFSEARLHAETAEAGNAGTPANTPASK